MEPLGIYPGRRILVGIQVHDFINNLHAYMVEMSKSSSSNMRGLVGSACRPSASSGQLSDVGDVSDAEISSSSRNLFEDLSNFLSRTEDPA